MAISPRGVVRSTSCLILRGVFGVSGSNGTISGLTKSNMSAAQLPSWKIQMAISLPCGGSSDLLCVWSRMRFSESADRMALFPV